MSGPLRIHKYPLTHAPIQAVAMPKGARILSVQLQRDEPTLWVLCDPSAPSAPRRILTVPTGGYTNPSEKIEHLATLQYSSGAFVTHVFEILSNSEGG